MDHEANQTVWDRKEDKQKRQQGLGRVWGKRPFIQVKAYSFCSMILFYMSGGFGPVLGRCWGSLGGVLGGSWGIYGGYLNPSY